MKKIFFLVLALAGCLSLSACGAGKVDSPTRNDTIGSSVESSSMADIADIPENPEKPSAMNEKADGSPEGYTVTDKNGNIYTLSSPILYTISASELNGVELRGENPGAEAWFGRVKEENSIIYAVSCDTLITAADGIRFDCILGAFIEEENGTFYCSEYEIGPGPGGSEFQLEDGWEGALFMFPCYTINKMEPEISVDFVDNIAFFVPLDETAGNPFAN